MDVTVTRRLAKRAVRRRFSRDFLSRLGPALTIALGVALTALLADRMIGPGLPEWALFAAPMVIAVMVALGVALSHRRTALRAAADVDAALSLHDRLSSALALSDASPDDPFAQLAARDAESLAAGVSLKSAIPIRLGGAWIAWPFLAACALGVAMYMPSLDLLSKRAAQRARELQAAQRDEAIQQIQQVQKTAERTARDAAPHAATPEQLDVLKRVEEELAAGKADPDQARSKAASALGTLADASEQRAEQQRLANNALQERFAGLPLPEPDNADAPSSLGDALRRGDTAAAQRTIEGLKQRLSGLDEAQRRRVSEQLDQLAKSVESSLPPAPTTRDASDRDPLRDQGLSPEQTSRLREETNRDALRDELRKSGVDPETSERLADRVAQENREREAQRQAEKDARELSEAMRDAAEQVRKPSAPPEPTANPPSDKPPAQPSAGKPAEKGQADKPNTPPDNKQPPGDSRSPSSGEKNSGTEAAKKPVEGAQKPSGDQKSSPQKSDKPSGHGQQPTPDPNATQQQQPGKGVQQPHPGPESQNPNGKQQSDSGEKRPDGQPSQQPTGTDTPKAGAPDSNQDKTGRQPAQGARPTPGAQKPPEAQQKNGARPKPGEQSQEKQGMPQRDPSGAQQPGALKQPGEKSSEQPDDAGKQPTDSDSPPNPPDSARGIERLKKMVEEMSRRQDAAKQNQRDAEKLREEARKLIEQMSPEEQERLRQWGEQMAREQGKQPNKPDDNADGQRPDGNQDGADEGGADKPDSPQGAGAKNPNRAPNDSRGVGHSSDPRSAGSDPRGRAMRQASPSAADQPSSTNPPGRSTTTTPVDARRDAAKQRVLAEWFDPNANPNKTSGATQSTPQDQIREAVEAAQHAVEDQSVPTRRSDLIRRYFKRLPEVAPGAGPVAPAKPAEAAKDAEGI